jgi:hypothetical protein
MSEIKTSPNPENRFVIPRRKFSAWHFVVPILLIAALAGGWFAHALIPNATAPEANVIPKEEEDETPSSTGIYYTTTDNTSKETHLYSYMGSSDIPDIKVGDINTNALGVHGKYIEPNTYVVSTDDTKIQILDAKTGDLETLVGLDSQGYLRETAVSNDKKWLAYGLTQEGTPNTSDIWLYNIETKEKKQLVKKTELGTYQGFSVLGWRNDDQELIVSALGGDAGAMWGDIYQVTVATGVMTKVTPASTAAMPYFIRGTLSPNNNVWLYTFCTTPERESDGMFTASEPCTTGTEIRTYDFSTKQTKTVFHNLRFDNNINKNLLRSVLSMLWLDDKTIIAAIPGAIIEIDAGSKDKVTDLLMFDRNDPSAFKTNYISLVSASPEQIVFMRENGAQVLDRVSKKVELLNTDARSEFFSNWLD